MDEELQGQQASTLVIFIWGSLNPSHLNCELELPQNTRRQSLKKHPWGAKSGAPKARFLQPHQVYPTGCAHTAALLFLGRGTEGVAGPCPCWLALVGHSHQGPGGRPEGKRRWALPGQGCCRRAGPPAPAVSAEGGALLRPLHSKALLVLTLGLLVSGCSPSAPPTPLA